MKRNLERSEIPVRVYENRDRMLRVYQERNHSLFTIYSLLSEAKSRFRFIGIGTTYCLLPTALFLFQIENDLMIFEILFRPGNLNNKPIPLYFRTCNTINKISVCYTKLVNFFRFPLALNHKLMSVILL